MATTRKVKQTPAQRKKAERIAAAIKKADQIIRLRKAAETVWPQANTLTDLGSEMYALLHAAVWALVPGKQRPKDLAVALNTAVNAATRAMKRRAK